MQDAPDFRCIPPTNILRASLHVRIKSIQIAERRIGRVSKMNACISAIQNGSRARGAVSGLKLQRSHVAPVVRFGEQRSARASTRPSTTGSAGTQAICPCASAYGGLFQPKRVLHNHVAPVLRSAEQRSARASTQPAATRAIRTYAHMVTRRFAPRDGLHLLVRAYVFTETLRRAAQREGVDMTACHGLGVYTGGCGRSVSPYGGLPEPKRLLRILLLRRSVSPKWLPYGQI